jgi:hypothetical protein
MKSVYDMSETPLSDEELAAVRQNARERLGFWRKRALGSAGASFISCLLVYLFLDGSPLHPYWESFGKYLMLVSMALFLVLVYCAALLWGAWRALRDLEEERM